MLYWKSLIVSLLFIPLFVGCVNKQEDEPRGNEEVNTFLIKGVLESGGGETVVVEEMGAREFIPMDTAICNEEGKFKLEFTHDRAAFYILRYGPSGYITLWMEPGEILEFSGGFDDKGLYEIEGSKGSELLRTLSLEHRNTLDSLGEITKRNMEWVSSPDYADMKRLFDLQFDSISNQFRDYSLRFITENANSPVILVALYNMYGQGLPVFSPENDLQVYQFVDSALMSTFSELEAVKLLHSQLMEAEHMLTNEEHSGKLQKREIAPDFVSSRPDGSELALSDLKGEYVLISFWAGWSSLSREENLTLKRAMETYRDSRFRILQISLDEDRELWTGIIQEDQLDWDHVCDLKRWETPVVDLYHVERIPSNVLIDPEGRIVETDLFGERLLEKLEILFKQ